MVATEKKPNLFISGMKFQPHGQSPLPKFNEIDINTIPVLSTSR
ncbi:MAG: hypothetical protein UR52_C0020G0008 [Candidatus Gottesmanbacteria bacterium GW2011_GWA1_34_13]|uniref:Uncharacterized protein n=1 Tax=Candidatus Gottesmanbacteria bacterium GW2011_GWA1_34_13 TaxID=1618434 RepID=A0A0G0B3S2_9BACT|nr:MAG: hypothetical protein UR52_C0020G0008 [Candidatus Gottesmanbacteria bacterium GW2011_GWA1_34_13]